MLRVARYTLATALVTVACAGCRDSAAPSAMRPAMSSVADTAAARFLVVFTGPEAPPDFAGRVAALGGGDTIFDTVGFAVASGLTAAAAQELRSAPGVRAVETDLILGAADADESAAADLAGADATEVAVETSGSPPGAAFYSRQWNLRA